MIGCVVEWKWPVACLPAGVVAAADVTAVGAAPEMDPLPAELETLDATVARRGDVADLIEVGAGVSHALSVAERETSRGPPATLVVLSGT